MHKGRPYPYHPTYWAFPLSFWPDYVPWKIQLGIFPTFGQEWALSYPPLPGVLSDPGVPDNPAAKISYTVVAPLMTIVATFDIFSVLGVQHGRLSMQATGIGGGVSNCVIDLGVGPISLARIFPVGVTSPGPPDFPLGGTIQVAPGPASYTLGGSPWPRVP